VKTRELSFNNLLGTYNVVCAFKTRRMERNDVQITNRATNSPNI